jgi:hypothetical protein
MKRLRLGLLAMVLLVMSGCGDTSVAILITSGSWAYPPSISMNYYSKDSVHKLITGSVSFYAPDSDVNTITISVFDSRGFDRIRSTSALFFPGVTSGTVPFRIDYAGYPDDVYTFSIFVTDFNGYTSNLATGSFSVP